MKKIEKLKKNNRELNKRLILKILKNNISSIAIDFVNNFFFTFFDVFVFYAFIELSI